MKKNLLFLLISLLYFGTVHAQNNHFTPDGVVGTYRLNVMGEVLIDGEAQTSEDIEVGLFFDEGEGEVCKATAHIEPYFDYYRVFLICSHDTENATVTFKLYNHATEEELDNCEYTFNTIAESSTMGNFTDPIALNFVTATEPQTYQIDLSVNPANAGTVSGGGTVNEGATATVMASANEGYAFVNWTENGNEVSTTASYSFTVTGDRALVANFEETTAEVDYPWEIEVNPAFNEPITFMGILQINGETVEDPERWDLGAFCGDNYRTSQLDWYYDEGYQVFIMTIQGLNGDQISFKLYDKNEGAYHPGVCDYSFTFDLSVNYGIIGDFDDPQIVNFVYVPTFTKPILGYDVNEGDGHYYLIASPIGTVAPAEVGAMLSNSYDLYYFDQNASTGLEWINFKDQTNGDYELVPGKGYLYANSQNVTLTFTGMAYNGDGKVTLDKDASSNPHDTFEGWNLVGNPFAQTAYIDRPFYTMSSDGSKIIAADEGSNEIAAMTGVFVIATEDGEEMTFSKEAPAKIEKVTVSLKANRGNIIDRAIIRFDEGRTLPKFMLNEEDTKLYIPQENEDYAVVRSTNNNEIPMNFKASNNGTYTLSVNPENVEMEYLHLIDNMTGADIDLLATPNYQFNATVNDPASRFTLNFKSNASVNTEEVFNPILFSQDGKLTISGVEGESELQLIDMLGRVISTTTINGEYNKTLTTTAGVYMVRLTNNGQTYTQKIVVK